MFLPDVIIHYRTNLARIVASLFALLGLTGSNSPERIARALHRSVASILRPAESATRRLIVFLAAGLKAKVRPASTRALPADFGRSATGSATKSARGSATPGFQLFDTRPPVFRQKRPRKRGHAQPRITFFSADSVRTLSFTAPIPQDDGLENAARLARRLFALKAALDNLPRQAQRLARALVRRQKIPQRRLTGPLRPGRPPGYRQRPKRDIDTILHRCDALARDVVLDTS